LLSDSFWTSSEKQGEFSPIELFHGFIFNQNIACFKRFMLPLQVALRRGGRYELQSVASWSKA
jgi:hypothetical protein